MTTKRNYCKLRESKSNFTEVLMPENEMLTPQEVADYLKVSVETVWRWCRNDTLPAVKIGTYWRIPRDELETFIATQMEASQPEG